MRSEWFVTSEFNVKTWVKMRRCMSCHTCVDLECTENTKRDGVNSVRKHKFELLIRTLRGSEFQHKNTKNAVHFTTNSTFF